MTTIFVLAAVALAAVAAVVAPIWQQARRPWSLNEPEGEAEALRQEELSTLEALRDLAMDYKLSNLNATDYRALTAPLESRAKRVQALQAQRQIQSMGSLVITPDLEQRLEAEIQAARRTTDVAAASAGDFADKINESGQPQRVRYCHQCGAAVQPADRFCAACGAALRPGDGGPVDAAVAGSSATNGTPPINGAAQMEAAVVPAPDAPANLPAPADTKTVQPTVQPRAKATAGATAAPRRRRLWWGAAGLALVWVAVIAGVYLQGRSDQTAQTPVVSFDGAVRTLKQLGGQLLLSTDQAAQLSTDGVDWHAAQLDEPVLAATALGAANWLVATPSGLWQSGDGVGWQPLETELRFVGLASAPRMGVAWGVTPDSLYQSSDVGITWALLSETLPGQAQAFAAGPGVLFLGTEGGVFSSADAGQSWTSRNGAVNGRIADLNVRALAYDGASNVLYAGTPAGVLFLNLDGVGSWGQRALAADVTALAVGGEGNQVLWAGTADGQLFRSPDRGVTWR